MIFGSLMTDKANNKPIMVSVYRPLMMETQWTTRRSVEDDIAPPTVQITNSIRIELVEVIERDFR